MGERFSWSLITLFSDYSAFRISKNIENKSLNNGLYMTKIKEKHSNISKSIKIFFEGKGLRKKNVKKVQFVVKKCLGKNTLKQIYKFTWPRV
jgi:hypothetical protein